MAFSYGFYNSLKGDRKYSAEQISAIFDGLITDGVFSTIGELFATIPGEGLQVIVKSGKAWFNHTWNVNDSSMPFFIAPPDVTRPRYDAVVLEVDARQESRKNAIKIITGTPDTTPVKPAMSTTERLWQHPLAYILVEPNVESIDASKIEIVVGQDPCPFVTGILESVDITDLFNQWEGDFDAWFENVKAQLTEDVVTNLQYQIDQRVKISDKATENDLASDSKWLTPAIAQKQIKKNVEIGDIIWSDQVNFVKKHPEFFVCDGQFIGVSDHQELFNRVEYVGGYSLWDTIIDYTQYLRNAFNDGIQAYSISKYGGVVCGCDQGRWIFFTFTNGDANNPERKLIYQRYGDFPLANPAYYKSILSLADQNGLFWVIVTSTNSDIKGTYVYSMEDGPTQRFYVDDVGAVCVGSQIVSSTEVIIVLNVSNTFKILRINPQTKVVTLTETGITYTTNYGYVNFMYIHYVLAWSDKLNINGDRGYHFMDLRNGIIVNSLSSTYKNFLNNAECATDWFDDGSAIWKVDTQTATIHVAKHIPLPPGETVDEYIEYYAMPCVCYVEDLMASMGKVPIEASFTDSMENAVAYASFPNNVHLGFWKFRDYLHLPGSCKRDYYFPESSNYVVTNHTNRGNARVHEKNSQYWDVILVLRTAKQSGSSSANRFFVSGLAVDTRIMALPVNLVPGKQMMAGRLCAYIKVREAT